MILVGIQWLIMITAACVALVGVSFFSLIHLLHVPLGIGYSPDLQALADTVWVYLLNDESYILIGHEQLTMSEELHLLDVKKLLNSLFWVWISSSVVFLGGVILNPYGLKLCILIAKLGLSLLLLLLVTTLILSFKSSFVYVHRIFFCQIPGGLPMTQV